MENLSVTQQAVQQQSMKSRTTQLIQYEHKQNDVRVPPVYQRQRDGLCRPHDSDIDPTNNRRLFNHHENQRVYNGFNLLPVKQANVQATNVDIWPQPQYSQRKHSPIVGHSQHFKINARPISEFNTVKHDIYGIGNNSSARSEGKRYFNVQDNLHDCIQQTEIKQFVRQAPTSFKTKKFW